MIRFLFRKIKQKDVPRGNRTVIQKRNNEHAIPARRVGGAAGHCSNDYLQGTKRKAAMAGATTKADPH
jgi:hypothetical protein